MKFDRRGLLISPTNELFKGFSYAANPYVLKLTEDKIRVFYNSRDAQGRSHIFSMDFDYIGKNFLQSSDPKLLMQPGPIGSFDDSGVSVGSMCKVDSDLFFYYMGWNLGVTVPWRNSIGIASYDQERNLLVRTRNSPVMDRSEEDPYTISYPFVFHAGTDFKMFYGSNRSWNTDKVDIDHIIKLADSIDGINWNNRREVKADFPVEANAFCRPSILLLNKTFYMAFAYRREKYKIGFMSSSDLNSWKTEGSYSTSDNNWESDEVTYPTLFKMNDSDIFMLYCGNGYGKTGVGLTRIDI